MLVSMIYILVGLIGLSLGSFVNALVWRMRHNEVINGKKTNVGKKTSNKEAQLSIVYGRSICVKCKHQLAWSDLIPVMSWLALSGKCRYCHKKISIQYPLVELLVAFLAVFLLAVWPFELTGMVSWIRLGLWLSALPLLVALVIYDIKYMIMPTVLIYTLDVIAVLFALSLALEFKNIDFVVSPLIGSALIGGFFLGLHVFSKGKWIGGGDVRFGFTMGLFLGWQSALFALALASYLGTALVIVLLILGKYHKKMRLPFGPFLVAGTYIALLYGNQVIDWYKNLAGM